MNRKSRISFGPGAASLILIVVILSMSVLGILSLMNAHSDSQLSARSVETVRAAYQLNAEAERRLSQLDALAAHYAGTALSDEDYAALIRINLPADMTMDDREIAWSLTDGYRTLECAAELLPLGKGARLKWTNHRLTAVTEDVWN